MDPCTKSREIEDMQRNISKIEENIEGNGKPGMKAELIMIKEEQKNMNNFLRDMNTNVSAVVKFMIESQTVAKVKLQTRDVVNMIMSLVLALGAIVTAIIIKG